MGDVCAGPLPPGLMAPGVVCGKAAAFAVVMAGSDLRPRVKPRAKNNEQIATRPKNNTSSLPVPNVISVSWDDDINPLQVTTPIFQSCENPHSSCATPTSPVLAARPALRAAFGLDRKSPPAPGRLP